MHDIGDDDPHFFTFDGRYARVVVVVNRSIVMNRTLLAVVVLAAAALSASAVKAKTTLTPYNTPDIKGGVSSTTNATAEQALAQERIRGAGFTAVNSMQREADGTWRGRARKGNAETAVSVDPAGRVTSQ
jgi:hypothetical protein